MNVNLRCNDFNWLFFTPAAHLSVWNHILFYFFRSEERINRKKKLSNLLRIDYVVRMR